MKNKTVIEQALDNVQEGGHSHFGITYEQGVEESLMWVLG